MRRIGSGSPPLHRFRVGLEFALKGYRDLDGMVERHAALAAELARRIGLPEAVQEALAASYEHVGRQGLAREAGWEPTSRSRPGSSQFAEFMEVAHRVGGVDAATALARSRSGTQFDPEVVAVFCAGAAEILRDLDTTSTWAMVVDSEPALGVHLSDDQFDQALDAIAAFVDLKSPYFLGHSRRSPSSSPRQGPRSGLDAADLRTLRRAGLAHGFGRLGISNSIWDKPGPLGAGERERVRMHPYLNERMLQQSPALAPLARDHGPVPRAPRRERVPPAADGWGDLERGARARRRRRLSSDARAAAAPPERDADTAAAELRREVGAGRLDGDAVDAVLEAAGQPVGQRRDRPAGLTAREVEVLRLVSRGLSSKEIAGRLVISPKTARNHIEHIYTKIGASSRVNASLFAIQHGLLPVDAFES